MRSEIRLQVVWCAAVCVVLLMIPGCARTLKDASLADTLGATDVTTELDFWDELALQDAVTNHDALHALMLTFGILSEAAADDEGEGEGAVGLTDDAGFEAKVGVARMRGWLTGDGELIANETAQVGWIARAVCMEAGIEGGLSMRLFGPIPRYALRELNYERLMGTKSENQSLSGLELIATIGRIQDRRTGLVSAPRQDF